MRSRFMLVWAIGNSARKFQSKKKCQLAATMTAEILRARAARMSHLVKVLLVPEPTSSTLEGLYGPVSVFKRGLALACLVSFRDEVGSGI